MVREILVPTEPLLYLRLPDDFVGKRIEVIAFPVEEATGAGAAGAAERAADATPGQRLAAVRAIFADVAVDLSAFRFDRDAANEYAA